MRAFFIILLISFAKLSVADIHTVKPDSTGDYLHIQNAIIAATNGDTILVWPGTYYENLNFTGKSLTLTSLILTTGDESYKYSTIIDGNQSGRCITIDNYISNAVVQGFTICNGRVDGSGGGLFIYKSNVLVINNIIRDNFCTEAGGGLICYSDSQIILSGNSIFNNHCYLVGGGVSFSSNTLVSFDSINRNNIYLNFSSRGCDFYKSVTIDSITVYLDTGTVFQPDRYFYYSSDGGGGFVNDILVSVQHAALTPIDADLFVNPVIGNNDNSGLNWDEPLESIAYAFSKIAIDSTVKNTIHLANGLYSDTTNYEKFPLNIRQYTNVQGQSRDGVILDGNRNTYIFKGNNNITDFSISGLTLQGGPRPTYDSFESRKQLVRLYEGNGRFILDSIVFRDSYALNYLGVLTYYQADSSIVRNCEFYGNKGGYSIRTSNTNKVYTLSNLILHNNQPDYDEPDSPMGVAFTTGGNGRGVIQNSLFYDNEAATISAWTYPNLYLVNCTFTGNSIIEPWTSIVVLDADMHIYNCISYNEGAEPLAIGRPEPQKEIISHLNIYNSLIEGGELSILIDPQCDGDTWCKVHYDETNIDTDPIFLGKWDHPYQINNGSPCIDAGTLANLPDFIELPENDLAGNPRVVGDSIDMGAYEWNPTVGIDQNQYQPIESEKPKLLTVAPNPFRTQTIISANWDFKGQVQIEIYNNLGLRVALLQSSHSQGVGSLTTIWEGKDQNGDNLKTGVYHVIMFWNGKKVEYLKVIIQ